MRILCHIAWIIASLAANLLALAASSAAEPVVEADGARSAEIEMIDQSSLLGYLAGRDEFTLIDARSAAEFETGHILRAVNVPHDAVDARLAELPSNTDAPLVVYCKTGRRASLLMAALEARGFTNVRVLGPTQIFWSDTAPMFNCGVPAAEREPSFLPSERESR